MHNYLGLKELKVTSAKLCPRGGTSCGTSSRSTGKPKIAAGKGSPGRGQLYLDGKLVGDAEFDMTVPIIFGIEGLSCGYDFGEAVTHDYRAPFRFTGMIHQRDGGSVRRFDQRP